MVSLKKDGIILRKTTLDFESEGVLNPAVIQDNGKYIYYTGLLPGITYRVSDTVYYRIIRLLKYGSAIRLLSLNLNTKNMVLKIQELSKSITYFTLLIPVMTG